MSTSRLSIRKSYRYDVFLSFMGEDTRKNIVDHLYHALKAKGIYTYKDDVTIKIGKTIDNQLNQAIKDSRISIIVFSKNYASSSWCLKELVKIMECRRMTGHIVYPIFYDVDPTEVRKQSGAVGKAFARHRHDEAAGQWKEALKEAAELAGWDLRSCCNGFEAESIKNIVQEISSKSRSINLGLDDNIFGTGNRVRDVVSYGEMLVDDARALGIQGMGMAGKFQKLCSKAKSFVRNAREVSKASMFVMKKFKIMHILMVFICYFLASSYNSSAPKIMVSTSTLSIKNSFRYDVFLSFRGEDTRKNFVDHLYHALKDKGIYTYKDDEKIQKGERISDDLFKSIEDSKFYIIVFSKNYASSSWCLEELVKIMECQKMTEHAAYPVFYDVEPTEVRKQSGPVAEALAKHEKEARNQSWLVRIFFFMNKKKAMLKKWKGALKEAANLAGWELKNTLDGHEAKFINKIVQEISLELRSINFGFDGKLVGMETRVRDVVSSLEIGIDEVRMIGIKGMGGAGKTAIVRAVFDHLSTHFEAKSFVGNLRKASMLHLKNSQEQVLSNVLNEQVTLDSVDDGKNMMKKRTRGKKILLVLDDVDDIKQVEALAGEHTWFKRGSRILITTRDAQVLEAHSSVDVIRDIALLSDQEAISLFSRSAFGRENPLQGYEELSGKAVRYAAGLPLTLERLGSELRGKDKLEWVDAIERLKRIPFKATQENLELSYKSLDYDYDYQQIFLDIACIFKGQYKQKAIRIFESFGFNPRIGLKVLEQKSLITYDEDGLLGMHNHIEEMGMNIVRREHPDEPNKHSRLWINEEIEDILVNDMGTEATECLKLNVSRGNERIVMKGLGKMKKLRYLEVNFADYDSESDCERDGECLGSDPKFDDTSPLDESTQYFPNSLKYLKCSYYPFLHLPTTFQAKNLVGLEMKFSRRMVQLWEKEEKKVLRKLRFLSLDITNLTTFDFKMTPNLEALSITSRAGPGHEASWATAHGIKKLRGIKFL